MAGVSVLSRNQITAQQQRNTTALNYKGPPSDYLQLKNGNQICLAEEKFSPREIEIAAAMGAEIEAPSPTGSCAGTREATLSASYNLAASMGGNLWKNLITIPLSSGTPFI